MNSRLQNPRFVHIVDKERAYCEGQDGSAHPRVYYAIDQSRLAICRYCGAILIADNSPVSNVIASYALSNADQHSRFLQYIYELYYQRYNSELSEKEVLMSGMQFPASAIALMFGSAAYLMLRGVESEPGSTTFNMFVGSLGLFLILLCFSVYYLARSTHYYNYIRIDVDKEMHKYVQTLQQFHLSSDGSINYQAVNISYMNHMIENFASANHINFMNNSKKLLFRRKCLRYVLFALVSLAIVTIPLLWDRYSRGRSVVTYNPLAGAMVLCQESAGGVGSARWICEPWNQEKL